MRNKQKAEEPFKTSIMRDEGWVVLDLCSDNETIGRYSRSSMYATLLRTRLSGKSCRTALPPPLLYESSRPKDMRPDPIEPYRTVRGIARFRGFSSNQSQARPGQVMPSHVHRGQSASMFLSPEIHETSAHCRVDATPSYGSWLAGLEPPSASLPERRHYRISAGRRRDRRVRNVIPS